MSNPGLITRFDNPDPNSAPLNITQLVQLLDRLVHTSFAQPDSYVPYLIGKQTPHADQQNYAWIQVDDSGRPLAVKVFYNGNWRRVYNGMLGEIRLYNGDPIEDFDENGLGKIEGNFDGWHLCNGKDGTPDLSDRFPIAAHMNNEDANGYQGGEWVSTAVKSSGEHQGGNKEITLGRNNTFQPDGDIGSVKVGRYIITPGGGETLDAAGPLFGVPSAGDPTKNMDVTVTSDGSTTPEPVNIIPPYVALAYIIFVGYN